jgi:hypothetical protein
MLLHKETINLNVFCTFMEFIIVSDLDKTLIITVDDNCSRMNDTHVFK